MKSIILHVDHLTKKFVSGIWPFERREYIAVNDISFKLHKGEIIGLLGPNGAGKTTTIQMLLGTLTSTRGTITYFDKDFAAHRIAILKHIGYASGYDRLPVRMTVLENLEIIGRMYSLESAVRAHRIEQLLKSFRIWHLRHRLTDTLSAGQVACVMLAKAFIACPDVVLLDEPNASLDPNSAYEVRQFILEQNKEKNISILIASHNMDEVSELCDRVLVLNNGTIIANNTPENLARSVTAVRVHLTVLHDHDRLAQYLQAAKYVYAVQANQIIVECDEHLIAPFLADLTRNHFTYTHIAIDTPTLEDYFLSMSS